MYSLTNSNRGRVADLVMNFNGGRATARRQIIGQPEDDLSEWKEWHRQRSTTVVVITCGLSLRNHLKSLSKTTSVVTGPREIASRFPLRDQAKDEIRSDLKLVSALRDPPLTG